MKKVLGFLPFVCAAMFLTSCDKKDSGGTTMNVRLTDNPFNAEAINIDIKQVRVKYRDDSNDSTANWADLQTNAHVYNILNFQNGVDTALATGAIPTRSVKEIRFILGTDNSIKIAGVTYPLTIPSGGSSGLKIKVDKDYTGDVSTLIIDFDAALSVSQTGAGTYQLKPVLKVKS